MDPASPIFNIYVKGITAETTKQDILDAFEPYGGVLPNMKFNPHQGWALVALPDEENVKAVMSEQDPILISGFPVHVEKSKNAAFSSQLGAGEPINKFTVYITPVSHDCRSETLESLFSMYGKVVDASVHRRREGNGAGYGYVTFEKESALKEALAGTIQLGGEALMVQARTNYGKKGAAINPKSIHVRNLPNRMSKEELATLFSRYGSVARSNVSNTDTIAFVAYESQRSAEDAVAAYGNDRSLMKVESRKPINNRAQADYPDRYADYEKCVYISDFKKEPNENQLRQLFEDFGTVEKVSLVPARYFGFVDFDEPSAAQAAIDDASSLLDGSLIVEMTKPKRRKGNFSRGRRGVRKQFS